MDPQRNTTSTNEDLAGILEMLAMVTSDVEEEQRSLDYCLLMGET